MKGNQQKFVKGKKQQTKIGDANVLVLNDSDADDDADADDGNGNTE